MRKVDPEKFEAKRGEILAAAGRCFARYGFQGAPISAICGEAGVSPGHLYHYFANKEAIVAGMIEAGLDHATRRFEALVGREDFVAALTMELENVISAPNDGAPCPKRLLIEMMAEAGRSPWVADMLAAHSSQLRELLVKLLREAQAHSRIDPDLDPNVTASLLLSLRDGAETLTLRDPQVNFGEALKLLRVMITRFLVPSHLTKASRRHEVKKGRPKGHAGGELTVPAAHSR